MLPILVVDVFGTEPVEEKLASASAASDCAMAREPYIVRVHANHFHYFVPTSAFCGKCDLSTDDGRDGKPRGRV